MLKIQFSSTPKAADTVVVGILPGNKLSPAAEKLEKTLIAAALKRQTSFTGKAGQVMTVTPPEKSKYDRIVLYGVGEPAKMNAVEAENTGGKIAAALAAIGCGKAVLFVDSNKSFKGISEAEIAAHMGAGAQFRTYTFDKYKQKAKDDKKPELKSIEIVTGAHTGAAKMHKRLEAVAAGTHFARDLMNEPPNVLYPDSFAKRIAAELKPLGVVVEIIDEKKMKTLGMGSALAVGQGSEKPSRMVVLRWDGAAK